MTVLRSGKAGLAMTDDRRTGRGRTVWPQLGHSEKSASRSGSFPQLSQQLRTSLRNDIILTSWSNNNLKARDRLTAYPSA